jgi:hypothetical protein
VQPTQELIDAIFRDKVLSARKMSLDQKFIAGPELFAMACRIMKDGIRNQHPDADEQRVHEIMLERLALGRRLREPR